MFSFCCGEQERKKRTPAELLVEFSLQEAGTGRVKEVIQKFHSGKVDPNYKDWKRMKFKSANKKELEKKSYFSSFIDEEFPHTNASITYQETDHIQWKRVGDVVKMPIFASADTFNNFQRIAMRNKTLKEALTFIKRTHPMKLKKFLAQEVCTQGIYEFKLYNKGLIQNVIIDDYFPYVAGQFLFANPIRQRQIFPLLLQKAIAKICGSYEQIPEDVDRLLEILFCGPLRKTKISELSDKKNLISNLQKMANKRSVGGFISKKEPKIRNFGINENQLYNITNFHEVYTKRDREKVYLVQLVSQKKLVAWNGKYSHNDSSWDQLQKNDQSRLFKSLKQNKSFCLSAHDIPRIFETLMIFEGTDNLNKDWIQNTSDNDHPSFTSFQLSEPDTVFIKVCTQETTRTSLILTKLISHNHYVYETGAYLESTSQVQVCKKLPAGKYLICVHHEWTLNKSGSYTVFLSSNEHTSMIRENSNNYQNFLQELFKQHSEVMRYTPNPPKQFNWNQFYSICNMSSQNGFAYLYIKLNDSKQNQRKIDINQKQIKDGGWQLLQPNSGRAQIVLDKKITPQVILILRARQHIIDKKMTFPTTAFLIQK